MTIIDLFAGPGGWDLGARIAGLSDPIGFELGANECATRAAGKLRTIHCDVSQWPLAPIAGAVTGLIASPPCPAFSIAGNGEGRRYLSPLRDRAVVGNHGGDLHNVFNPLVWLILEPLRWIKALQPEWVAMEQVPTCLPIWRAYQPWLEKLGYHTWAGVISAEQYGVPQTRKRAILMASQTRRVTKPVATHQMWTHRGLVGSSKLPPPRSVYDAIGLPGTLQTGQQPGPTVAGELSAFKVTGNGGAHARRAVRNAGDPSPTITGNHDVGEWIANRPATTIAGDSRMFSPGGHTANDGRDNTATIGRSQHAIRLTQEELLTLQTFPPTWPVQGTQHARQKQIGNAVPPLLAAAILEAVR
jgi:DNA (cytosine-5)-methyltransferase 1